MTTGKLLLAVETDGAGVHPAAWRSSGAAAAALDPRSLRERVALAERAGFAFATFGDQPVPPPAGARVEAGVRAAYLSQLTRRIGLAPTLHVTTTEPFHLATQLASLDHASHGRAAWVVGAANDAAARATIGAAPLDDAARGQEIRDVIDVARALWDSWEDDAVIKDVATGRFIDNDKVHHVRFEGASFSVVGPLITPRPPQGQVVVIAADSLGVADRADITLVGGFSAVSGPNAGAGYEEGAGYHEQALARRAGRAREAGSPLVFAELEVALGTPGERAASRLERLNAVQAWPPAGRARFTGTPAELAEFLAGLAAHVDGVLFYPAETAADLPVLAGEVLPALAAAGRARRPGPDDATLRDVLGLPRPANRFARPAPAADQAATNTARSAARA
jgi:alkanesulfonate monooxygenase SsuD/methylene tetrahydromethanopterin reductase-like flavin-dependent oxidoreductase (luciferase family)